MKEHEGAWDVRQTLNQDGTITGVVAKETFYNEDRTTDYGFTQSISMYKDRIFLKTTRNTGEVYVLYS